MPSLKRGKDNAIGVTLPMATADGGGTEQRHIPAFVPLTLPYPVAVDGTDATPVTATSGNVANAAATATIPAVVGKTAYISGFTISGAGATAGLVVNPTMTGVISGTKTFCYAAATGPAVPNNVLDVQFCPPIPASAVNTAIAVSCPALGAGNTNNSVNAYGFYL